MNGLTEDTSGALWISTADGLLCLRDGKFTTFTSDEGLPSNTVLRVYQQHGGRLIAVTTAGLAVVDGGRLKPIAGTGSLGNADGSSLITEDAHGTMWAAGARQLVSISAGSMSANQSLQSADLGTIQAISASSAGSLWVGGHDGVAYFNGCLIR